MNPTPDDIDDTLRRLLRDHIHAGFAGFEADPTGHITIYIDDLGVFDAAVHELHLHRLSTWADRWTGWYAEVQVTLALKVPADPATRPLAGVAR